MYVYVRMYVCMYVCVCVCVRMKFEEHERHLGSVFEEEYLNCVCIYVCMHECIQSALRDKSADAERSKFILSCVFIYTRERNLPCF